MLLPATILVPGLLALLLPVAGRHAGIILRLAPWAPIPGLVLALTSPTPFTLSIPWLVTGTELGLDLTGRVFLFFTSVLWLLAGVHARAYLRYDARAGRFFFFHLLALTGNLGLVVALDVVSFYLFFAIMTFAGFGLVVHSGNEEARRAGRVYLAMAVAGEAMLIAGILLAVSGAGAILLTDVAAAIAQSGQRDLIIGLLLAGFGIKAGALPLHVWLPLAHPVAPTPASAVLSGSMIKAGLLGWLRVLPLGLMALPGWGGFLVAMGLGAAFFGVVVGVTQRDPKTTLAYSSISQMGIINIAIGLALMNPRAWAGALAACLAYATHHGLAKGALFLGVGVAREAGTSGGRRWVRVGLVFAALAVAGAPLTSGSVAKGYLKDVAGFAPGTWPLVLDLLLPLTAVGTTLLMARFLSLSWNMCEQLERTPARGLWMPWAALLGILAAVLWVLPLEYPLDVASPGPPTPAGLWIGIWPIVTGAVLAWSAIMVLRRLSFDRARWQIAAGDLLHLVESGIGRIGRTLGSEPEGFVRSPIVHLASRWYGFYAGSTRSDRALRLEIGLTRWGRAAALLVLMVLVLAGLLAFGRELR